MSHHSLSLSGRVLAGLLFALLASTACENGGSATPTPSRIFAPSPSATPTWSPTPRPTLTPTVTPTPFPLNLFRGFVDTGCSFGIPSLQLLDCLARFTGTPLRITQGALTATRDSIKGADGKDYDVNVLDLGGMRVRNIQGTTYWDLTGLTPTPAATQTRTRTQTPTPIPQQTIGSLRFYDFDPDELKYIAEAFQWVNDADREAWRAATVENIAVYRVEPDFLSKIAAISGMATAYAQPDMFVPYAADRVQVRSDYVRAMVERRKGSTYESNLLSFVALLGRNVRRAQEYRAYRATGKTLNACADITYQQERIFEAAGFRAQGEIIQKAANGALEKGIVAVNERNRDEQIRIFRTETGAWVKETGIAAQSPEFHAAPCYPPTPTPTFTPAPPTLTPTLAPGTGSVIVVNPHAEATFTINGPSYTLPPGAEIVVNLPQGLYSYTASFAGYPSVNGTIQIQAGKYIRFTLPAPPVREPPTRVP